MFPAEETVFEVSELNALARELLEGEFGSVAVTGEISNLRTYASGHVYFKLKDAAAQISAVCFQREARALDFEAEDGMQVVARGRVTLYDAQGQYQLVVREMVPAGRGELERAFRILKEKLQAEGLFDSARKRALPEYPRCVAVITSPTGAAIRDIFSTLQRRFPCVEVLFVPVQVQGDAAPAQIVRALDAVSAHADPDLVIVGRGGGSIEDLWAFNDEAVARAIHRCSHPVISAVGHESDFTIADFVADVRAATPTMAAEIAVPDRSELLRHVGTIEQALALRIRSQVESTRRRVTALLTSYALGQVRGRIERAMQRADHLSARLASGNRSRVRELSLHAQLLVRRMTGVGPRVERTRVRANELERRILRAGSTGARERSLVLGALEGRLAGLDPRAVLMRGYSVCADARSGRIIDSSAGALGARDLRITFHDGAVHAAVDGPAAEGGQA